MYDRACVTITSENVYNRVLHVMALLPTLMALADVISPHHIYDKGHDAGEVNIKVQLIATNH